MSALDDSKKHRDGFPEDGEKSAQTLRLPVQPASRDIGQAVTPEMQEAMLSTQRAVEMRKEMTRLAPVMLVREEAKVGMWLKNDRDVPKEQMHMMPDRMGARFNETASYARQYGGRIREAMTSGSAPREFWSGVPPRLDPDMYPSSPMRSADKFQGDVRNILNAYPLPSHSLDYRILEILGKNNGKMTGFELCKELREYGFRLTPELLGRKIMQMAQSQGQWLLERGYEFVVIPPNISFQEV